jgi:hypothetical protein
MVDDRLRGTIAHDVGQFVSVSENDGGGKVSRKRRANQERAARVQLYELVVGIR